jgi:hypothetical protein
MRMTDRYDFTKFWGILAKFPDIKSLADVTAVIKTIENDATNETYPDAYNMLKEFESAMRSHIYTEWHAQESLDGIESP